ncbi:hypothetical protein NC986_17760 [Leptolyngbya sp. PL-A2]
MINFLDAFSQVIQSDPLLALFLSASIGGILSLFINEWYRINIQPYIDNLLGKRRKQKRDRQSAQGVKVFLENFEVVHAYKIGKRNASLDNTLLIMDFIGNCVLEWFILLFLMFLVTFYHNSLGVYKWSVYIVLMFIHFHSLSRVVESRRKIEIRKFIDLNYDGYKKKYEDDGYIFTDNGIKRLK